jgi:hypothetical protein
VDPQIEFDRSLRQMILRTMYVHDQAGLAYGFPVSDLAYLVSDSVAGSQPERVIRMIRDLLDRRLVVAVEGTNPPRYVLTADGRDFCRAGYPWAKIDRFSGDQRA